MRAWIWTLVVLTLLALRAPAQDDAFEEIELRVTSAKPGVTTVDRGTVDGLAVGDRVQLLPREGFIYQGRVARCDERTAEIELDDRSFVPSPGTRGTARVPKSRLVEPEPVETPAAQPSPTEQPIDPSTHAPWKNEDDEWKPGDPLLAKVRPVHPKDRPLTISGRLYTIADQTFSSEDDRKDGFYRAGASVLYDNLSGRGDRLYIDGELNYRNTDVPDDDDDNRTLLRLDRFSYAWGGNRFEPDRFEVGRFLQRGLPEFGVLDGLEWGTRTRDGNRYGVSFGFMPEPDEQQDTGSDYQIAGYYRWVNDESETLSGALGYQKSFHSWNADRDLLVGTFAYLPVEGWNLNGTAWVDVYTEKDDDKGAGVELTQMYARASRRYDSGSSVSVVYTHVAFPEIDRNEFNPVTDQQLADDHNDRLAVTGKQRLSSSIGLFGSLGGWIDEDEEGGDFEGGFELEDVLFDEGVADISLFHTRGRFVSTTGGRLRLSKYVENGRWSLDYDIADHHFDGFSAANDDLPQHRLRASRDVTWGAGWSFSGHLEAGLWDNETSVTAGFYLQRSF